jgi:hypothetical protein
MKSFKFINGQIKKLNVFFQHKMLLYSDIKFDEIALRYFYIEYYAYEGFVKSSSKAFDTSGDIEMTIDTNSRAYKRKKYKDQKLPSEYID